MAVLYPIWFYLSEGSVQIGRLLSFSLIADVPLLALFYLSFKENYLERAKNEFLFFGSIALISATILEGLLFGLDQSDFLSIFIYIGLPLTSSTKRSTLLRVAFTFSLTIFPLVLLNDRLEGVSFFVVISAVALIFATFAASLPRAKLMEDLVESEARIQDILGNISEAALLLNKDFKIEALNQHALTMLLIDPQNAEGTNPFAQWKIKSLHPRDSDDANVKFKSYLLNGMSVFNIPLKLTHKEGRKIYVELSGAPLLSEEGKCVGHVLTMQDISHDVETEKIIEEQQAVLKSSANLSSLGEMAAGIAHEIINPLSIINGKGYQIKRLLQKPDYSSEDLLIHLNMISSTVVRISKIINSMRSYAREGQQDPFELVTIYQLFEDTLVLCREKVLSSSIQLTVDIEENISIACRPWQISQVILNLIQNATDALQALPGHREIHLSSHIIDNHLEISVADNGPGVPKEFKKKIMQPFFTTKSVGKGTGLGLSISQKIAKSHHGDLYIEDTSVGAKFVIMLPLIKTQKIAA